MTVVPTDWTVMPKNGVKTMIKFFQHFLNDETGAAAAEYALILAIVGTAIAGAALALGTAVSDAMGNATDCIENPTTGNCAAATTGGGGTTG